MSSHIAGAGSDLPDLDDRLVEPGTRYEMLDGELVYVPPADFPHAALEAQLCALITMHVTPGYHVGAELLTRTSKVDDIAPDVSVCPPHDPETGKRRLQQLAFEVVSTQSLGNAARKAAKLAGRGVRRVFAIDVERSRALEWSAALGTWSLLDPTSHITDPALAVPLAIEQMIRSAKIDDAVARALIAKRNPVIGEVRAEGRMEGLAEGRVEGLAEGRVEGLAEAVLVVLAARSVALDLAERDRICRERDRARLERWIARAATCLTAAELLAEP
jgi:Uma2 family endonuclease